MAHPVEELFLYYKGPVLYDTIGHLISELKEKMFEEQVKQTIYKKVLMVMIEALENVFKYHENFEKDELLLKTNPPEISIIKSSEFFNLTCSNPIKKEDINSLKMRLEYINNLDKEGVKEEYKKTITNGLFSEKGGAGLGLIEMAKITDSILNFSFTNINGDYDYYRLNLKIHRG